jgi:hypothetical protein
MLATEVSMPAAQSHGSQVLDPLGTRTSIRTMLTDLRDYGATDIYINYFADKHGGERTGRRVKLDARNEVILLRQALKEHGLDPDEALSDYLEEHKDLFAITFKKEKKGR